MSVRLSGIVIDAIDLDRLSSFWSGLLDLPITHREDDWISLGPAWRCNVSRRQGPSRR